MTRKELMKLIDEEVTKVASEPIREPVKQLPETNIKKTAPTFNHVLTNETEVDEYLFKAGMKD